MAETTIRGVIPPLPDEDRAVTGPVAVTLSDGRIAGIVADEDAPRNRWIVPAPVNAHDHGRSLPTLAFGAPDDVLEFWLPSLGLEPRTDPYLRAATAFARMARAGIAATNHCHNTADTNALVEEAEAVSRAARDVGICVAFSVPIADRNPFVYGDNDRFVATLPPAAAAALTAGRAATPSLADQLAALKDIAAFRHPHFILQAGPVGPQWVSDHALETLASKSAFTGLRLHMHLFETAWQKQWADATYPGGLIAHLDKIGFLSPRLTVAHGVMLREEEIARLAERGVTVALNTSSNLRLRSGIAPVDLYQKHGLTFAIGLDGMAPDDDDDILREARLAYQLHRGFGGAEGIDAGDLFRALWRNGRPTLGLEPSEALLCEGAPADVLVLDADALGADVLPGAADPATILVHRMNRHAVRDLFVGGQEVVSAGKVVTVDAPALEAAFFAQARAAWQTDPPDLAAVAARREATEAHYRDGAHRAAPRVGAH